MTDMNARKEAWLHRLTMLGFDKDRALREQAAKLIRLYEAERTAFWGRINAHDSPMWDLRGLNALEGVAAEIRNALNAAWAEILGEQDESK